MRRTLAIVVSLATVAVVLAATSSTATAATFSTSTVTTNVAAWVDDQGRVHGAWTEGPTFPSTSARTLRIARLTAAGAIDTTYGTNGVRAIPIEAPPAAADYCTAAAAPKAVSFTSTGEVVLGLYRPAIAPGGACVDQPIIDRYSLAGARLARSDSGATNQTWVGAALDGNLARARLAVEDDFQIVGPTGGVVGSVPYSPAVLPRISVDQLPGGPVYVTVHAFGGAVQVHRVGGGLSALSRTSTCDDSNFTSTARVLPGPGSTYALACFEGVSETTAGTLTLDVQGTSSWTRTVTGTLTSLGSGYVAADGKVVLGGGGCTDTCGIAGGFYRIGATGSVQPLLIGAGWDIQRVLPIGAGAYGWTALSENDEGTIRFTDVSRGTIGGSTPATVPAKPAKPTAVPGPSQATVSWTAPSDGGSPITGYRITPYRAGVAQTPIDVAVLTSKEITALTNGTAYRFTVAARNAIGLGPASDLSDPVTPATVPGAPTNVVATAGKANATVTWTPPASDGGSPITGYRIQVFDDGVSLQIIPIGNVTSWIVPDLFRNNVYTFRVAAVNAIGTGPSSVASNPILLPPAGFASWPAATSRQFRDLLGRAPTAAETATWVPPLQSGAKTLGELPAALRTSTDHASSVDPVTRLYSAYLGRIPDRGGLTYWIGKKRGGTRLTAISSNFAASSEFKTKYGSLTNRAFVELVYRNVLGRAGDAGGISYWTRKLDSKAATRGQVMVGFSESSEYKRKQAERVTAIVLITFLLGRAPTTTEVADVAAALKADLTVAELADQIIESDAYAQRIARLP